MLNRSFLKGRRYCPTYDRNLCWVSENNWRVSDNLWEYVPANLGKVRIKRSITEMTRLKKIVPAKIKIIKGGTYDRKFTHREALDRLIIDSERNRKIGRYLLKLPRPILVLTNEIKHLDFMSDDFSDMKIDHITVVGSQPKWRKGKKDHLQTWRTKVIQAMRDEEVSICIASPVWDEGVDIPFIRSMVLSFPFKNWKSVHQRVGRGLRKAYMKPYLIVLDINDEHRVLNEWFDSRLECYRKESVWRIENLS